MKLKYGFLLMFSLASHAGCIGSPTDKCSNFTSWSDNKSNCEHHYKTDITGIGSQCYWQGGAISGGYCLASITPCWSKKILKKPHTHH